MTEKFYIKRGDLLPVLTVTLLDVDGNAVSLTTATEVLFKVRRLSSLIINAPCDFVDRAGGKVSYTWQSGDTDVPGTFNAEFEVTWPSGKKLTFPNDTYARIVIKKDLD